MFKDPILNKLHKKYGPHEFEDRSEKLYEELVELSEEEVVTRDFIEGVIDILLSQEQKQ